MSIKKQGKQFINTMKFHFCVVANKKVNLILKFKAKLSQENLR